MRRSRNLLAAILLGVFAVFAYVEVGNPTILVALGIAFLFVYLMIPLIVPMLVGGVVILRLERILESIQRKVPPDLTDLNMVEEYPWKDEKVKSFVAAIMRGETPHELAGELLASLPRLRYQMERKARLWGGILLAIFVACLLGKCVIYICRASG